MFRIDDPSATGSLPAPGTAGTEGYFTEGAPGVTPATLVRAAFLNMVQEELRNVVTAAGLTPSKVTYDQVATAIKMMMQRSVSCVATGAGTANAITAAFTPPIEALTNGMTVFVRAGAANTTSTPTFTPNSETVAATTIVKGADAALSISDIAGAGHWLELQHDQTLGKWVLQNPATGITNTNGGVGGAFRNLAASATGTSATVSVSTESIVLEDSSNKLKTYRAVSLSVSGATAGTNGLDTGSLAGSTWYALWVIGKDDGTVAGLLSTSSTSPTLPSGYTYKARVGWVRTDGTANKYPLAFKQAGRRTQYVVATGSNLTGLPVLASGVQGSPTTPTWAAASVAAFVPPTAGAIHMFARLVNGTMMAAPNNAYGLPTSANAPPFAQNSNTIVGNTVPFSLVLESGSIYVASDQTAMAYFAAGWEDNL